MTLCSTARTKTFLFISTLVFFFFSCKKETTSVDANFVGIRNGFQTFYDTTIDLTAYTVQMDSFSTSRLSSYAIGSIYDPFLGKTNAAFVTQLGLPGNQFSWGFAKQIDSLVLQLRFRNQTLIDGTALNDYYGEKDAIHKLNVYFISEDLSYDSLYYSRRKYRTDGLLAGSWEGKYNFVDSVTIKLGTQQFVLPPHIRIPMNQLFKDLLYYSEANGDFLNNTTFRAKYKGLVVVDESEVNAGNPGAIAYIKLTSDVTSLTAYYQDSLAADFSITYGSEAAYNYYNHTEVPNNLLQNVFVGNHRDTCFVQPLGGTKVRIEIPNLYSFASFANPKMILNGAQIELSVLNGTSSGNNTLPISLSLAGSDSLGRNIFLKDQLYETNSYYGGQYDNYHNQFRFNIVRHLQYLLSQNRLGHNYNYGMNLISLVDNPVSSQRVVLDTRKGQGKIKLKLTYTVVK